MSTYFKFKGFEPDPTITAASDAALLLIAAVESNPESTIVARVEFDGQRYGCSIDVFRRFSSLYVFITDADPLKSITRATEEMQLKLLQTETVKSPDYQKFIQRRAKENYYQ
jgi:hypothetical protein